MTGPVQRGRGEPRESEEQPAVAGELAGRRVAPIPAQDVAATAHALGLSHIPSDLPHLSPQELAAAEQAREQYNDEMPVAKRLFILRHIANRGTDYLDEVVQAVRNCPDDRFAHINNLIYPTDNLSDTRTLLRWAATADCANPQALALCSRFLQPRDTARDRWGDLNLLHRLPADQQEDFIEFISDNHGLLDHLRSVDSVHWLAILEYTANLTGPLDDPLFFEYVFGELCAAQNPTATIIALEYLYQQRIPKSQQFLDHINYLGQMRDQELALARYCCGPGQGNEKLELLDQLANLEDSQKMEILSLLDHVVSHSTPLYAISTLVGRLQIGWMTKKAALRNYYKECASARKVAHIILKPDEELFPQMCSAILENRGRRPRFYFEGSPVDQTCSLLRSQTASLTAYIADITEDDGEGRLTIRHIEELTEEQVTKAQLLGCYISLYLAEGITLPDALPLSPQLFTVGVLSANYNLLYSCQLEVVNTSAVELDPEIYANLYKTPLPPVPKERTQTKQRISDSVKNQIAKMIPEDSFQAICISHFKDDSDFSPGTLTALLEFPFELHQKATPLFTDSDTAEMRLQLIESLSEQSSENIAKAARLTVEGDSLATRFALVTAVESREISSRFLPILPSDPPDARLLLSMLFRSDAEAETARNLPLFTDATPEDRYQLVRQYHKLGAKDLTPQQSSNFIHFLREARPLNIPKQVEILRKLSREDQRALLDLEATDLVEVLQFLDDLSPMGEAMTATIIQAVKDQRTKLFSYVMDSRFRGDSTTTKQQLFTLYLRSNNPRVLTRLLNAKMHDREATIARLSELPKEECDELVKELSGYQATYAIGSLAKMTRPERLATFENAKALTKPNDQLTTKRYILETLADIPPAEHQQTSALFNSFFTHFDSIKFRQNMYKRSRGRYSYQNLRNTLTRGYRKRLRTTYQRTDVVPVEINEGDDPYAKMMPYLTDARQRSLLVQSAGQAIDAGGPSRELLTQMATRIPEIYGDILSRDELTGRYSISMTPVTPESEKLAAALGHQLYLMRALGIPLPPEVTIDPEVFVSMSRYSYEALEEYESLQQVLASADGNLEQLQEIARVFVPQEYERYRDVDNADFTKTREQLEAQVRERYGEEEVAEILADTVESATEMLEGLLEAKTVHYRVARAMTLDGYSAVRPIDVELFTTPVDVRSIMENRDNWDFSELGENADMQAEYMMRWVREASDEQLVKFLRAMGGLSTLPKGQRLKVSNQDVQGAFYHSCFFHVDLPPVPNDSPLTNYENWKQLFDYIPQDYTAG
ncbi:MAG: hypothetical protein S4CHLAM81_09650 [Chlamydiales bacterium]|nr:hypothetical protein [Chlamydiales bacterium]MCH9635743.1 hypothetical protein [Chlamydiales bacterium]MCH9703788.1 HECT domain-containing protein [Chlamydiota bacterium]